MGHKLEAYNGEFDNTLIYLRGKSVLLSSRELQCLFSIFLPFILTISVKDRIYYIYTLFRYMKLI